jgi:glycosyltransferase involved in cell wall biosynthesis
MKVLMATRYGNLGASSRLRHMQYAGFLEAAGVHVTRDPFFDDHYLARLYANQPTFPRALTAYARRARQLRHAADFDVIWLEKEALPWLPWAVESKLLPQRVPLIVDLDDAVFHNYDLHHSALVRHALGDKIDRLMARAAMVTAGNTYLAERAQAAGAARVEIVPTVVDLRSYVPRPVPVAGDVTTIGWIGTPTTWHAYVQPMMPLLAEAAQTAGARILAVGAGAAATAHPLLDNRPWTEASEVSHIHQMSIGIMPLDDTPWARGKCGYKLIQYMACGLPVIASPVGVNAEIVEHGVNGLLATSQAEWREAIRTLLHDPDLRQRMGAAGRKKVEEHFALQAWGPRVADMLLRVAKGL